MVTYFLRVLSARMNKENSARSIVCNLVDSEVNEIETLSKCSGLSKRGVYNVLARKKSSKPAERQEGSGRSTILAAIDNLRVGWLLRSKKVLLSSLLRN